MSRGLCRHCHKRSCVRPRGLCGRCYNDIETRDLYPAQSRYRETNRVPALPDSATTARPGTEEKVAVMAARFAAGRAVFHPDDVSVLAGDDRLMADSPP